MYDIVIQQSQTLRSAHCDTVLKEVMLGLGVQGPGAVSQGSRAFPDQKGCEEWWDVGLELGRGRLGCYPLADVGLGVTCPYLYPRGSIRGPQGRTQTDRRMGAGSLARR